MFYYSLLLVVYFTYNCEAVKTALVVIDVQNCFLPGGSLAVPEGEAVIPVINNIRRDYGENMALTVFTQVRINKLCFSLCTQ